MLESNVWFHSWTKEIFFTVIECFYVVFVCCSLTDAVDVWSTDFTEETLKEFVKTFALKSTEDYILKLKSAGSVYVVVGESTLDLHVGPSPGGLGVTLSRLDGPRAAEELKELLFTMANRLAHSDGLYPAVSPMKNHHRRTEFEPRQQNSAPLVTVKKRLPGASLINPGAKKKREATGVAFDDADED
uniref:PAXX non-homologous end joining factor n=1 Tax=Sphaeramia orbicularis TaxID=375764 RepID=A0A672YJS1_9TELE